MSNDQWEHRSAGMKCSTCMYYVLKAKKEREPMADISKAEAEQGRLGRCRRHAPTMKGYPAVFETDWCGDHKLDENKI